MTRDADTEGRANAFKAWRSAVKADISRAARLLAKSKRIVEYYEAGRAVPLDTRRLMALLAERGATDTIPEWPDRQ